MSNTRKSTLTLSIAAAGFVAAALAQTDTPVPSALRNAPAETLAAKYKDPSWQPPRTSWGHPSLEGVWSTDDMRSVPMNRPERFGDRQQLTAQEFAERANNDEGGRDFSVNEGTFLRHEWGVRSFGYTSLVIAPPSGRVPALTAAGEALAATRVGGTFGPGPFDAFEDFNLYDRCITRGVLGSTLPVIYGNGLRITQNPDYVSISYEMIHDTRIIPLDGRPHLESGIEQWLGSPRGRWEGDTLVVETTNFTDRTNLGVNGNGPPNSTALKLTERFTRIDPEKIEYIARVEDPIAYAAPWAVRLIITTQPGYQTYEYSCHEGNGAVRNSLSGERVYEQQVAEAAAKGLPPPPRAVNHDEIRNGVPERAFNINAGE